MEWLFRPEGKSAVYGHYQWFLARTDGLSWREIATVVRTSWNTIDWVVSRTITWKLTQRSLP